MSNAQAGSISQTIRDKIVAYAPSVADASGRVKVSELRLKLAGELGPDYNTGTINGIIYTCTFGVGEHGYRRLRRKFFNAGKTKMQTQANGRTDLFAGRQLTKMGRPRHKPYEFENKVIPIYYAMLRTGKYGGTKQGDEINAAALCNDFMSKHNSGHGHTYRILHRIAENLIKGNKTPGKWVLLRDVPEVGNEVVLHTHKRTPKATAETKPVSKSEPVTVSPMADTCAALLDLERAIGILKVGPLAGILNGIVHDLLG